MYSEYSRAVLCTVHFNTSSDAVTSFDLSPHVFQHRSAIYFGAIFTSLISGLMPILRPSTMRNGLIAAVCGLLASSAAGFAPIGLAKNVRLMSATPSRSSCPVVGAHSSVQRHKTILREASSSVEDPVPESKPSPIVAIINLFGINEIFRLFSIKYAIAFPASLSGCGALFATFLFAPFGGTLYGQFAPGAAVLAKWLPVFFVPSLIALPLANSVGSSTEVSKIDSVVSHACPYSNIIVQLLKIAGVVVGGFFFTLLTTAYSVLAVRKILGTASDAVPDGPPEEIVAPAPAPKAFDDNVALSLKAVSLAAGLLTVIAKRMGSSLSNPLATLFMFSATLSTFVFGARLPKRFTKIVHPLVTCTSLTWLSMMIVGRLAGDSFRSMLVAYAAAGGAGKILLSFLGPAVISLACQMFDRRKLMKENIGEVAAAITVSSFGGLFGTALAVRLLAIGSPALRLSLLSRNITSPLAMAIAAILGADVSLAVSMVVVTGLIGANFGASILDAVGIKDAVARGLGIGAAAHGLGTAAFANEKDAFPFAAIAMALTASACTVLVSVPVVKSAVMRLALG